MQSPDLLTPSFLRTVLTLDDKEGTSEVVPVYKMMVDMVLSTMGLFWNVHPPPAEAEFQSNF
jgi:hypothetical protein